MDPRRSQKLGQKVDPKALHEKLKPIVAKVSEQPKLSPATEALHQATLFGDPIDVRQAIDEGGDVNALIGADPLIILAIGRREGAAIRNDVVSELLRSGACVNVEDAQKMNPLHHAVLSMDPDLVRMLINAGVPVDEVDSSGYTPLRMAVLLASRFPEVGTMQEGRPWSGDCLAIVRELIDAGARTYAFENFKTIAMTSPDPIVQKELIRDPAPITVQALSSLINKWHNCDEDRFGIEFLTGAHPNYIHEKFGYFRDDPFRYFGTLDDGQRYRFVRWLQGKPVPRHEVTAGVGPLFELGKLVLVPDVKPKAFGIAADERMPREFHHIMEQHQTGAYAFGLGAIVDHAQQVVDHAIRSEVTTEKGVTIVLTTDVQRLHTTVALKEEQEQVEPLRQTA